MIELNLPRIKFPEKNKPEESKHKSRRNTLIDILSNSILVTWHCTPDSDSLVSSLFARWRFSGRFNGCLQTCREPVCFGGLIGQNWSKTSSVGWRHDAVSNNHHRTIIMTFHTNTDNSRLYQADKPGLQTPLRVCLLLKEVVTVPFCSF